MPNNDFAIFTLRMGIIIENGRQWIFENSYSFVKTDAVLLEIYCCFI